MFNNTCSILTWTSVSRRTIWVAEVLISKSIALHVEHTIIVVSAVRRGRVGRGARGCRGPWRVNQSQLPGLVFFLCLLPSQSDLSRHDALSLSYKGTLGANTISPAAITLVTLQRRDDAVISTPSALGSPLVPDNWQIFRKWSLLFLL